MTPEEKQRRLDLFRSYDDFNRHNGLRLTDVDDGTATVEVTLRKEGLNPRGIAHGGLIFTLCDVATGVAARTGGRTTVSQDASIYFLRPGVNTEKLTAKGRVLKEGRTTGYAEAEVFNDDGTLIAKAAVTVHYLDDRKA
jgi:acyl-CoA thioesterase